MGEKDGEGEGASSRDIGIASAKHRHTGRMHDRLQRRRCEGARCMYTVQPSEDNQTCVDKSNASKIAEAGYDTHHILNQPLSFCTAQAAVAMNHVIKLATTVDTVVITTAVRSSLSPSA